VKLARSTVIAQGADNLLPYRAFASENIVKRDVSALD
jgi:hypothetical protein